MITVHILHAKNQLIEQLLKRQPEFSLINDTVRPQFSPIQPTENCIFITDQLPPAHQPFPTEKTIFIGEEESFGKAVEAINLGASRCMRWDDRGRIPQVILELMSPQLQARNVTDRTRALFLNALLTPNISQAFADKMLACAGVPMQWNSYTVWVLEVISFESSVYKYEKLVFQILKIVSSLCSFTKVLFLQDQERIIGYVQDIERYDKGYLADLARYLISQLEEKYQCMIRFGIGKAVHKTTQLYDSYQTALQHSVFDLALGTAHVMHSKPYDYFPEFRLNCIQTISKLGEKICQNESWQPEFTVIVDALTEHRGLSQDRLQFYYLDLAYRITGILISENFLSENERYSYLMRFHQINTLRSLKMISEEFLESMTELVRSKTLTHSQRLVAKAKRYIDLQYQNPDLKLENVAEAVHISAQYLSRLFKKEMNIPYVEYVKNYRIQKSLPLLKDRKYSIQTVAMKVGYSDVKYFSLCFKKNIGVSPLNYRKNIELNLKMNK